MLDLGFLWEKVSPKSSAQREYLEKMNKRFSNTVMQAKVAQALAEKQANVARVWKNVLEDIDELDAESVRQQANKLRTNIEKQYTEQVVQLDKWYDDLSQTWLMQIDLSKSIARVDEIDEVFHKNFVEYWTKYQKIQEAMLDALFKASHVVFSQFENWRWLNRTTQNPLVLRREEAISNIFADAAALLEDCCGIPNPEGRFLHMCQVLNLSERDWLLHRWKLRTIQLQERFTGSPDRCPYNLIMERLIVLLEVTPGAISGFLSEVEDTWVQWQQRDTQQLHEATLTWWQQITSRKLF